MELSNNFFFWILSLRTTLSVECRRGWGTSHSTCLVQVYWKQDAMGMYFTETDKAGVPCQWLLLHCTYMGDKVIKAQHAVKISHHHDNSLFQQHSQTWLFGHFTLHNGVTSTSVSEEVQSIRSVLRILLTERWSKFCKEQILHNVTNF